MKRQVQLRSFNGALTTPDGRKSDENYWLLIGQFGTVVGPTNERGRVLVQFEASIASLGLVCHNELPNSLLIFESDLVPVTSVTHDRHGK